MRDLLKNYRVATRVFEGKHPEEPFCFEMGDQWDSTQLF
jgi:hypothetical protein